MSYLNHLLFVGDFFQGSVNKNGVSGGGGLPGGGGGGGHGAGAEVEIIRYQVLIPVVEVQVLHSFS